MALSISLAGKLTRLNILRLSIPSRRSLGYETPDRWTNLIGDREIVGFGKDGSPSYFDDAAYPCPAIRFQRNSPFIQALREKEKCDWRNLTIEEKKCLYRASFCQTFSEFHASTGDWKSIVGWALIWVSCGIWLTMMIVQFGTEPLPRACSDYELIRAQMKRAIDIEQDMVFGLASKWDYENECWKPGYSNKYYSGEKKEKSEE